MALISYSSRVFTGTLFNQCKRKISMMPSTASILTDPVPRTNLRPTDHTSNEIGMWYHIDEDRFKTLFSLEGIPNKYRSLMESFGETCLMIRSPALEVIDYLKRTDYNQNAYKYIFYGRKGTGRTFALAHIIDYLHENNFILVHLGRPGLWSTGYKEILRSLDDDNTYDHTVLAVNFLQNFRNQNSQLITKLDIKTKQPYVINFRETIEPGCLLTLVEYGIQRGRYATLVIRYLLEELMDMANNKEIKLGVVIDGINTLYQDRSHFYDGGHASICPGRFNITKAFKKLLHEKWINGCIIGVVDQANSATHEKRFYTPRYLLKREGWLSLDPFMPISVPEYTKEEFRSALLYYNDRKWLRHPMTCTEQGVLELEFLSSRNPRVLNDSVRSK